MATTHTVYALDVRLREIEPPLWRTIEVPGRAALEDVHFAIQPAMGWTNSHLHQFAIAKVTYGMTNVESSRSSSTSTTSATAGSTTSPSSA